MVAAFLGAVGLEACRTEASLRRPVECTQGLTQRRPASSSGDLVWRYASWVSWESPGRLSRFRRPGVVKSLRLGRVALAGQVSLLGAAPLFTLVCNSPVMTTQRGVLDPATSRWSDYVGTAAADDADVLRNTPSLYELAGVDRQRWTILGIDLASEQGEATVTVYGFDRTQHSPDSVAEFDQLAKDAGGIPVTAFPVPAEQVDHFLDKAFRRVLIRLVAEPIRDHFLVDHSEESQRTATPAQQ